MYQCDDILDPTESAIICHQALIKAVMAMKQKLATVFSRRMVDSSQNLWAVQDVTKLTLMDDDM